MGGEQIGSTFDTVPLAGSSPRGRGTAVNPCQPLGDQRFIPAWAGNRPEKVRKASGTAVHPRVGGEQTEADLRLIVDDGSSPRGRGTGIVIPLLSPSPRFIPAWAGNRGLA